MNLMILKYLVVIAGVLGTTMVVTGPLTPYALGAQPEYQGQVTAQSMIQFGSNTFYSELNKTGNEDLKSGVQGYSQGLLTTKEQEQHYTSAWMNGISSFKAGYNGCTEAFYTLLGVPMMQDTKEKNQVCDQFHTAREDLNAAIAAFTAAKASVTPDSYQGFTIGMVLPRASAIESQAEDAEISCMKAVLADRDRDDAGFRKSVDDVNANLREMKRLYPELQALSTDFNETGTGGG